MDRNSLPKGHILGWVAPSSETKKTISQPGENKPLSKSAAKNAKRKAKRQAEKDRVIKDNWEDDDDETETTGNMTPSKQSDSKAGSRSPPEAADVDGVMDKMRNLEV